MSVTIRQTMDGVIEAIESKDIGMLLSYFADDAVLFDPNFPVSKMEGKSVISCGYKWAFMALKEVGMSIEQVFESDNRHSAAFKLCTRYLSQTGQQKVFPQMCVLEMKNGKISHLQVYTPYSPKNKFKVFLTVSKYMKKILRLTDRPHTPVFLK